MFKKYMADRKLILDAAYLAALDRSEGMGRQFMPKAQAQLALLGLEDEDEMSANSRRSSGSSLDKDVRECLQYLMG